MKLNADLNNVVLSPLDEARSGYRTAQAKGVIAENLPLVLDYFRNSRIQLLIARCHVSDIQAAQAMEKEGFFLTDTLVYYRRDLLRPIPLPMSAAEIRDHELLVAVKDGTICAFSVMQLNNPLEAEGVFCSVRRIPDARRSILH